MIAQGSGTLVVARRPCESQKVAAWQYVPCTICLLFCQKDSLHNHIKRCPLKKDNDKSKCTDAFQDGLLLVEPHMPETDIMSQQVQKLIQGMRETSENDGKHWHDIF